LDPETTRRVLAPLRTAAGDRTVLLITHDPVALEFADRIVHLVDGEVATTQTEEAAPLDLIGSRP
jgi:ATP-binding cassette, subfamily B, bacterial